MLVGLAVVLATHVVTIYPGRATFDGRVEAMMDRGPIVELIIRCGQGTAIISYSKIDRRYCSPKWSCSPDMGAVIRQTCG